MIISLIAISGKVQELEMDELEKNWIFREDIENIKRVAECLNKIFKIREDKIQTSSLKTNEFWDRPDCRAPLAP